YFSQNGTIHSQELLQEDNDLLINQTNINAEYKPNVNSLLQYTLDFKPKRNEFYTDIDGEVESEAQTTTQRINNRGHTLGQNLGYTVRLSNNKLLAVNAFSNVIEDRTQLDLLSNRSLFDMGNSVAQLTK